MIITTGELATALKCSYSTILRLAFNRQIPNFRLGPNGEYRFNSVDIVKWIEAGGCDERPGTRTSARDTSHGPRERTTARRMGKGLH